MKARMDAFDILVIITALLGFIVSVLHFEDYAEGYNALVIFPAIFMLLYFPVLKSLRASSAPFTAYGLIGMQWIRFVLMPPICALAGNDPGYPYISPRIESLETAIMLILYEFFAVWLFCLIWLTIGRHKSRNSEDSLTLTGSRVVYLVFLIVGLSLYFSVGTKYALLHFFYIPVTGLGRVGDPTNTYLVLARQVLTIGLFLFFLWITAYSRTRYDESGDPKYVLLALSAALLNVVTIVGERRTAQIYAALVSLYILGRVFPSHKKAMLIAVGGASGAVLFLMSIYKFFAAFNYTSYYAALANSRVDFLWLSSRLQSYFFGPENVAVVIDFADYYGRNISQMLYDLVRSIFGFSFVMKGKGVLTSEAFNTYIYGVPTPSGHVISAVGYGYLFLGSTLSPVFALVNIIISLNLEKRLNRSKSYEMTYLWGYCLSRFATNLLVNTAPLISYSTIMFGTAGLLFLVAKHFRRTVRNNQYAGVGAKGGNDEGSFAFIRDD